MSSSNTWSDRRALFQKGRELHEPGRRLSNAGSSGGVLDTVRRASVSSINSLEKTMSNTSASPTSPTSTTDSTSPRRRSSAASQGMFSNLSSAKRGHEEYGERRASHSEMTGTQGMVSGWWNSTFRGMQKTSNESTVPRMQKDSNRRGVME